MSSSFYFHFHVVSGLNHPNPALSRSDRPPALRLPKDTKAPADAEALAAGAGPETQLRLKRLEHLGDGRGRSGTGQLGFGLADVDAAFEERAVFNADAGCRHVAAQRALGADVYAVRRRHVAAHLAQHHDLAGHDVGCDRAIAADGDTVARKVDRAFYLAVDEERFRSRDLALDDEGLADGGLLAGRDCG